MSDTVRKNLGIVTAYAYARSKGYEGTEEEFAELMASYADVAEEAAQSASEAAQSAVDAAESESAAAGSALSAQQSVQAAAAEVEAAQTAKTGAEQAAGAASNSANTAAGRALAASGFADAAEQSATNASGSATAAQNYSGTAATAAQTASGYADNAGNSATAAAGSATAAAVSAAEAAESARTLTIDTTLTQQGQAAEAKKTGDEISAIKADLSEYGSTSLDGYMTNGTYYPGSLTIKINGLTAEISGTTTGTGFTHISIFNNPSAFPNGLIAGQKIQITQECDNPYVYFRFYEYIDGTATLTVDISGNGTVQHTISEDATGCIIRRSIENGHTYNNVISKGYIFTSSTKQQIENAINENTTRIEEAKTSYDAIVELMPWDYVNIEVSRTDGLVNKWNEIAGTSGYAYVKQAVVEGEKYKVGGYYYGGNYPAYLILNGNGVLSFYNPSATGAFNNIEVTIPQNATHIVVNGYTSNPATIQKYEMVKAGSGGAKNFDSILVGIGTDYLYNDINSAIINNPNSIIFVDYGTYDTEITNIATDKRIIGKDRNLCVLFGTERNYDSPPIEISGGIVKHFTVNMENDSEASHKGYCLHSDTSDCIGKTLIVEDCTFNCTGQHSIGMGIWQNESVLYKNCEFVFKDEEETPAHAPFFAHNSGTSDGIASVRFHNCIFRGSGYALKLSSYSSNCTMQFEFIDCTFESDTLTGDNMIWTDYVTGDTHDQSNLHRFKGKMPLLKTSHGNNVSIANYTA